jgi:serine/threonine-protein kinase
VLDFGIVTGSREGQQADGLKTGDNTVQGTPAFMAPEQAVGATVDARADIYAIGCVAYWLLTGKFVFTADTPMGLLMQHVQAAPTPPSARTDQPIPQTLDRLVLACLAKDPAERPQTARELSARLAAVEGSGGWTQDRARSWWTTHQPSPS